VLRYAAVTALPRAIRWVWDRRRRVAPIVMIVGLLVVGGQLFGVVPRETEVRYRLGPEHGDVTSARIAYVADGEEALGARFDWHDGAPESVHHTVSLIPGRYEVRAELSGPGVARDVVRALTVPADGVVTIELFDQAYANR
jgi:hypothetical protein